MNVKPERIIKAVCDEFGITREQIGLSTRARSTTTPRAIACMLMNAHSENVSTEKTAECFEGLQAHSVYACIRTARDWWAYDSYLKKKIENIQRVLSSEAYAIESK